MIAAKLACDRRAWSLGQLSVVVFLFGSCQLAGPAPGPLPASDARELRIAPPAPSPPPHASPVAVPELDTSIHGNSRALRVVLALPGEELAVPLRWLGSRPSGVRYRWVTGGPPSAPLGADDRVLAPREPGRYRLELMHRDGTRQSVKLDVVVQVPFDQKRNGYLDDYFIGRYPTEAAGRQGSYAPPPGFIRVTRELADLRLSEHFRLREFLTHDQRDVWPKYAIVDRRLLDKLELVMAELERMGIPARRMVVMSGFRTPQYNRQGLEQGRASLSRHQWGDAADVWIDNDGDWYMDDLNGDGRRDTHDARVMLAAVERVEARFPSLVGGAGVYRDNGAHGPFLHIDARGSRARW